MIMGMMAWIFATALSLRQNPGVAIVPDRTVVLEANPDATFADISDFAVERDGGVLIADGWRTQGVYRFDAAGRFRGRVGLKGQGPGEYQAPVSVAVDAAGEIYVYDSANSRALVYDPGGRFRRALAFESARAYYLRVNGAGGIYLYNGTSMRGSRHPTIFRYGPDGGALLGSFSDISKDVAAVHFSVIRNGLLVGPDGAVYEMNPLEYVVRKFDPSGKPLATFPSPGRPRENGRIELNGPFMALGRLIVTRREERVDVFSTDGRPLAEGLEMPLRILGADSDRIYALDEEGDQVRIVIFRIAESPRAHSPEGTSRPAFSR